MPKIKIFPTRFLVTFCCSQLDGAACWWQGWWPSRPSFHSLYYASTEKAAETVIILVSEAKNL